MRKTQKRNGKRKIRRRRKKRDCRIVKLKCEARQKIKNRIDIEIEMAD